MSRGLSLQTTVNPFEFAPFMSSPPGLKKTLFVHKMFGIVPGRKFFFPPFFRPFAFEFAPGRSFLGCFRGCSTGRSCASTAIIQAISALRCCSKLFALGCVLLAIFHVISSIIPSVLPPANVRAQHEDHGTYATTRPRDPQNILRTSYSRPCRSYLIACRDQKTQERSHGISQHKGDSRTKQSNIETKQNKPRRKLRK